MLVFDRVMREGTVELRASQSSRKTQDGRVEGGQPTKKKYQVLIHPHAELESLTSLLDQHVSLSFFHFSLGSGTRPGARPEALTRMATAQATVSQAPLRTHLSLKGSVALVSDFFLFGIQSILYQREIYPSDEFRNVKKFGTQVLTTTDEGLKEYLDAAMGQVKTWLERGQVKRLVVAIVEKETGETRERWQFDIDVVGKAEDGEGGEAGSVGQDGKATSKENVE